MIEPEQLMQLAIDKAREGIAAGQSPFGCAIARGDRVLAAAHNMVWLNRDITAHAEINALRAACAATGEVHLPGAVVATTCEPCPMCMAALHWARVEKVYFGATVADATTAGFNELALSAADVVHQGRGAIELVPDLLADSCRKLFADWLAKPGHRAY